jgi:hypothetical protein
LASNDSLQPLIFKDYSSNLLSAVSADFDIFYALVINKALLDKFISSRIISDKRLVELIVKFQKNLSKTPGSALLYPELANPQIPIKAIDNTKEYVKHAFLTDNNSTLLILSNSLLFQWYQVKDYDKAQVISRLQQAWTSADSTINIKENIIQGEATDIIIEYYAAPETDISSLAQALSHPVTLDLAFKKKLGQNFPPIFFRITQNIDQIDTLTLKTIVDNCFPCLISAVSADFDIFYALVINKALLDKFISRIISDKRLVELIVKFQKNLSKTPGSALLYPELANPQIPIKAIDNTKEYVKHAFLTDNNSTLLILSNSLLFQWYQVKDYDKAQVISRLQQAWTSADSTINIKENIIQGEATDIIIEYYAAPETDISSLAQALSHPVTLDLALKKKLHQNFPPIFFRITQNIDQIDTLTLKTIVDNCYTWFTQMIRDDDDPSSDHLNHYTLSTLKRCYDKHPLKVLSNQLIGILIKQNIVIEVEVVNRILLFLEDGKVTQDQLKTLNHYIILYNKSIIQRNTANNDRRLKDLFHNKPLVILQTELIHIMIEKNLYSRQDLVVFLSTPDANVDVKSSIYQNVQKYIQLSCNHTLLTIVRCRQFREDLIKYKVITSDNLVELFIELLQDNKNNTLIKDNFDLILLALENHQHSCKIWQNQQLFAFLKSNFDKQFISGPVIKSVLRAYSKNSAPTTIIPDLLTLLAEALTRLDYATEILKNPSLLQAMRSSDHVSFSFFVSQSARAVSQHFQNFTLEDATVILQNTNSDLATELCKSANAIEILFNPSLVKKLAADIIAPCIQNFFQDGTCDNDTLKKLIPAVKKLIDSKHAPIVLQYSNLQIVIKKCSLTDLDLITGLRNTPESSLEKVIINLHNKKVDFYTILDQHGNRLQSQIGFFLTFSYNLKLFFKILHDQKILTFSKIQHLCNKHYTDPAVYENLHLSIKSVTPSQPPVSDTSMPTAPQLAFPPISDFRQWNQTLKQP